MLKEHIQCLDDIPISIFLTSIKEYPIHRHDGLELVYVLEGSIDLRVSYYNYALSQGDVFIVNTEDLHSIFTKSKDNLLLILQIDIESYKKYYPDIGKIIFVSESHYKNSCSQEIEEVKQYLVKILMEVTHKEENYKERVNQYIHNLLKNLINNFQFFSIEDQQFINENKYKGDKLQIDRIYRITDYLYKNYMKKITLDQLAEKEHLSKYYLSHMIKYATGFSFQELVNYIRLEQSEIALLGSNQLIGEIFFNYGFSSQRYFNSNFKKCYGMTPLAYRKAFKNLTIEKKNIEYLEFDEQQALIRLNKIAHLNHIRDKNNVKIDGHENHKIIDIDLKSKSHIDLDSSFLDCITLTSYPDNLTWESYDLLKTCQNDIGFEYVRLYLAFESGLRFNQLEQWIELLKTIHMKPIFLISNNLINDEDFSEYLKLFFTQAKDTVGISELQQWKIEVNSKIEMASLDKIKEIADHFSISVNVPERKMSLNPNTLFDTKYMPSYIIDSLLKRKKDFYCYQWTLMDTGANNSKLFYGGQGLLTINGMKKPSYYALYLLSKIENDILDISDGYIVTRKNDNIQILLYHYKEACDDIFFERSDEKLDYEQLDQLIPYNKEYKLKIYNLDDDYIIKRYQLNQTGENAFDYWRSMGCPRWISKEDKDLIQKSSFPKVTFSQIQQRNVCELHVNLEPFGVELITLEKNIMR